MNKLLVVRHGIAEDAEEFAASGRSDDERPLTDKGKREMARVAKGLRAAVDEVDLLVSSPLVRAQQTAEIVADVYGMKVGDDVEVLRPESSLDSFVTWARRLKGKDTVAVVGHDPHLSHLVTWLMSGVDAPGVAIKKGGACLFKFERPIGAGAGELRWLLTPDQLIACGAND